MLTKQYSLKLANAESSDFPLSCSNYSNESSRTFLPFRRSPETEDVSTSAVQASVQTAHSHTPGLQAKFPPRLSPEPPRPPPHSHTVAVTVQCTGLVDIDPGLVGIVDTQRNVIGAGEAGTKRAIPTDVCRNAGGITEQSTTSHLWLEFFFGRGAVGGWGTVC
ncbi:unnamed protein product [Arctogadus glacialis]